MTRAGEHLSDDIVSAISDEQTTPAEAVVAHAHLETCSRCQLRLAELRAVAGLLRALPSVEPPRDFQLGLRLVVDPPNVTRLRRWYAVARVSAASLAAAWVFLSAGALYVDSRPGADPSTQVSGPQLAPAPAASSQANAPGLAAQSQASAPGPAAQSAPAPSPPSLPVAAIPAGVAARSQAASSPSNADAAEQVAAATSVSPLPTPAPTPPPAPVPVSAPPPLAEPVDPGAPLRAAATLFGMLAALGIVAAVFVRHRLRAASHLSLIQE